MFHLSHFHRLVSFCWFGFGCWGGFVCFAFAFFLSTDQSVRSSCQPMTSLAYFHDCHCRYDERSIVQKKKACRQIIWSSQSAVAILQPSCWACRQKNRSSQIAVAVLQPSCWACRQETWSSQIAVCCCYPAACIQGLPKQKNLE